MSLLLDALKKAAEQKAEKSKESQAEARPSDETVIDADAGDISRLDAESTPPPRRSPRDETELDHTELETRVERTRVERDEEDETGLEIGEETSTRVPDPSSQMRTGEDETIIFAEGDVSDFMDGQVPENRAQRSPDDETDLSRLQQAEDTDLSQQIFNEDETEFKERVIGEEETNLEQSPAIEDQTDVSIPPSQAAEMIDQGEARAVAAGDDTDLSRPAEVDERAAAAVTDEDMSLLLVDREDTDLTGPTSVTDPQLPGDNLGAPPEGTSEEELALVDTTRHQAPREPTVTQSTTESSAVETRTITEGTTTRAETTSTRTYAPDNYDRTLMKLPSDDASRLFAGMKSDADVVMTPEYAKRVFQSKSTAQRLQYYKFYSGIALAILLAIGVYGLFEMQSASNEIESSLLPLKRDPMPGVIRQEQESSGGLNVEGIDSNTLELIESAENAPEPEASDAGVITEQPESVAAESTAPVEAAPETVTMTETAAVEASTAAEVTPPAESGVIASLDSTAQSTPAQTGSASSSLQITSGSRIGEKDVWLREAYAAYQSGNDQLAMRKYNQVLEVDPTNRNALLARAAINVQNNASAAAIKDYQRLLLINPKDTLAMTSLLSVANFSPREAESQLKMMLRDEPESPYLNFALANSYGAQNRWQEAQTHYFIALQNNPQDPNYAYNLAVSLEHIAKPSAAVAYYRRALDNFDKGLATFSKEVVDQRLETLSKL